MLATDRLYPSADQREELNIERSEWIWPIAFMLSLTMLGLSFPLGYLLVPLILINRFRNDRYDFIIMLTIFLGKYQLYSDNDTIIRSTAIVLGISLIGFAIFKKPPLLKKLLVAFVLYALSLITFAYLSEESVYVQIRSGMSNYLSIAYFMIPLLAFSGREFDIMIFFRKLFPIALIFCAYYFIDCAILNGSFFMPEDASQNFSGFVTSFYDVNLAPFSMNFPRRWPAGLYIMMLCTYPIVHYYKLKRIHWALIFIALIITRTFTFILGLIVVYFFIKGFGKKLKKYIPLVIIMFVALYFIDGFIPYEIVDDTGAKSSALRIKSSIDQIINIQEMQDDQDLAELGSGRMAQALPKLALLFSMDREWIGMGFLSRELTTSNKYTIENDLYSDIEKSIEVATGVEIVPIQIMLTIGIIGLILHILYYIYTWWVIRDLKHSTYYLSILIGFSVTGIAGFSGLIYVHGLYLAALALAAVIMANKREIGGFALPDENESKFRYE